MDILAGRKNTGSFSGTVLINVSIALDIVHLNVYLLHQRDVTSRRKSGDMEQAIFFKTMCYRVRRQCASSSLFRQISVAGGFRRTFGSFVCA